MAISCITLDDVAFDLEALKDCISKVPELRLLEAFNDPREAFVYLSANHVDVIFSDIEMPGLDGLQFIKTLKDPPAVVFVTSHPEMALAGFELAALDFIEKPLTHERFKQCATRCLEYFGYRQAVHHIPTFTVMNTIEPAEFIAIKDGHDLVRISCNDIIYVEASGDFVNIFTEKRKHLALVNLKNLQAQLPEGLLVRCHKSYMVNPKYMERMSSRSITLCNNMMIPLSGDYTATVEQLFTGKWFIKRKADS